MKIDKICVQNFRILKDLTVDLEDDLSLVIGKNNTGKTSFLTVLDRFLSGGKDFSGEDFSIDIQNHLVDLTTKKVASKDYTEVSLSLKLYISYDVEKDDTTDISELFLDLDETLHNLVVSFEYFLSYEKYCKFYDDYKKFSANSSKGAIYFLGKDINRYFETRIRSLEYGNEESYAETSYDVINKIIDMKIINARRDVANEAGKSDSLSLLASKYYKASAPDNDAFLDLQKKMQETDKVLTGGYDALFKPIVETIKRFSYDANESEISVISDLSEKIIQETIIRYKHGDTLLPEDYNGLGYLNLMAILFDVYIKLGKLKNQADGKTRPINLLFIEEPEAHTHPQMQYAFIRHIKNFLKEQTANGGTSLSLQTIISTHSSHIVSQGDFNDIKYFSRQSDSSVVSKSLKNLYAQMVTDVANPEKEKQEMAFRFIKQYVTLNRAELFFAEKAILIEGDTERLLISAMMKKFDQETTHDGAYIPLLSQNISVIEVGAYSHIFQTLLSFLNIKILIITDLDCAKKGEKGHPQKCEFINAGVTTNDSLKKFIGLDDLRQIVSLTDTQKTFFFKSERWEADANGLLHIAFQKEENEYTARSFEDAFLSVNLPFVCEKKENFTSLQNIAKINKDSKDYYNISNDCIVSKTGFALDVLLNSDDNFANWVTPKYIKEGLEWLTK